MFSLAKIKQSTTLVIFQELCRGVPFDSIFRLINTVLGAIHMLEIDMCFPWLRSNRVQCL